MFAGLPNHHLYYVRRRRPSDSLGPTVDMIRGPLLWQDSSSHRLGHSKGSGAFDAYRVIGRCLEVAVACLLSR